jgi:uncharacterized protein
MPCVGKNKLAIQMIRLFVVFLYFFSFSFESPCQDKIPAPKRYIKVPAGYLMVLRQKDRVLEQLENFARAEKIPAANFTGMGFVDITFGFFDFETKKYAPRDFKSVELASMHGTIAWKNDSPSIHAHGVVADKNFQAFGGHILTATVGTGSVEILITLHDKPFERKRDDAIAADVLSLD